MANQMSASVEVKQWSTAAVSPTVAHASAGKVSAICTCVNYTLF